MLREPSLAPNSGTTGSWARSCPPWVSWRADLESLFCIIRSQKTKTGLLLWSDCRNCLENVPNMSGDMAEMAVERAKWPAPSFFIPKEKHFKIYMCTRFNFWTKISFSFPQAQISGFGEHSYQEIIRSPESGEALSCAPCLPVSWGEWLSLNNL